MAKRIDDRLIGRTLEKTRSKQSISLNELAAKAGLPPHRLKAFENGEEAIPASTLWHCARILQVPIVSFYDEDSTTNLLHTILRIRDDEIRDDLLRLAQSIELHC